MAQIEFGASSSDAPEPQTRGEYYARAQRGRSGTEWDFTAGDYETEKDAEAALDEALERSGCFRVYKQVTGHHLQPRLGQEHVSPRIDRLLLPLKHMTDGGWNHGAIGIECKRTYEKVGKPINQMLDYMRSAFYLHDSRIAIIPSYVFLFPYNGVSGPLESIVSQQHLGWVTIDDRGAVHFATGGCTSLGTVGPHSGQYNVRTVNHGNKSGSR